MLNRRNTIKGLAISCLSFFGLNKETLSNDLSDHDIEKHISESPPTKKETVFIKILKLRKSRDYDHRIKRIPEYKHAYDACIVSDIFGIDYVVLTINQDQVKLLENCFEDFNNDNASSVFYNLKKDVNVFIYGKVNYNYWTFGRKEVSCIEIISTIYENN